MNENNLLNNKNKDPINLFRKWFKEAKQKEINDPNAMNLATICEDNKVSSRIVLLKHFDEKGFVFYTNSTSKKGISISTNTQVALNFYWKSLRRQVRIEGVVSEVSSKAADIYFKSRPYDSKIGAWASKQSTELESREELKIKIKEYSMLYKDKHVPRPPHWKGYIVMPILIEFWQEMPFRLHDRIEYRKQGLDWDIKRLYP